jgi:hypothetical protein
MGWVRSKLATWAWSLSLGAATASVGCGHTAKNVRDNEPKGTAGTSGMTEPPPDCAVSLAGNDGRHCAVYQDGSVWCWGAKGDGPGPSNFQPSAEPRRVAGVTHAERVIVGPRHSCAITEEGVVCWGDNESGQIDDSGTTPLGPTSPALNGGGPSPVKGIGLGDTQTCAVHYVAYAECRGTDASGVARGAKNLSFFGSPDTRMPGNGNFLISDPGEVVELGDWEHPSPLTFYGDDNAWFSGGGTPSCVLKRTGSVWCASDDADGTEPRLMAKAGLGEQVDQLDTGHQFLCALMAGEVWCEGVSDQGQTGTGQSEARAEGHIVADLAEVRGISVNDYSACALKADGSVWCWGNYAEGERALRPTQVSGCLNQTTEPLEPPSLFATRPSGGTRLKEASRARAQAMCVCAFGKDATDACIVEEDRGPNGACLAALAPQDGERFDCLAQSKWEEAQCFASCNGDTPVCLAKVECPPARTPAVEAYCSRQFCQSNQQALRPGQICDGAVDCQDLSDEVNCGGFAGMFQCDPERLIPLDKLCNQNVDCYQSPDEQFCP